MDKVIYLSCKTESDKQQEAQVCAAKYGGQIPESSSPLWSGQYILHYEYVELCISFRAK